MSFLSLLLIITGGWPMRAVDSVAVLKSARRAQEAFETTRRRNLPEREGGWSGVCGERIGRMCYWYEGGEEDEDRAPEEPPRIRQARARLLAALDGAAATIPGDEWIVGQRVRYLLEDGQPLLAERVVAECRAVAWWCEALGGLVRHARGDFVGADSAFAAALANMPDDERCRWSDISALLEGELADRYHRLDCAGRAALEARWWWLAQPLYSLAGNDRRTEHFARRVMVRIQQGRRTPFGLFWEDDLRDVLLRYGWPTWWTRDPPASPLVESEPFVTGHGASPAFHFAPAARALDDPGKARPDDWRIDLPNARERYAPRYATAFGSLDHQAAVFRRDDSCLVVAAYDLSNDTLFADRPVSTALALAADDRIVALARDSGLAARARALAATAPCGPLVVSLEAMAPRDRHVARARYGMTPLARVPGQPAISDLLLFDPPDSLPTTLDAVVPHAHGSTRVPPDHRLGVFWELYGVDPASGTVAVSLTVAPQGTGWLRRAVESVGLATRRRGVRMEWEEVPEGASLAPRALAIDLAGLSPGRYVIEVAVRSASGNALTTQQEIRIERP
jgi:hypothetical protein